MLESLKPRMLSLSGIVPSQASIINEVGLGHRFHSHRAIACHGRDDLRRTHQRKIRVCVCVELKGVASWVFWLILVPPGYSL